MEAREIMSYFIVSLVAALLVGALRSVMVLGFRSPKRTPRPTQAIRAGCPRASRPRVVANEAA